MRPPPLYLLSACCLCNLPFPISRRPTPMEAKEAACRLMDLGVRLFLPLPISFPSPSSLSPSLYPSIFSLTHQSPFLPLSISSSHNITLYFTYTLLYFFLFLLILYFIILTQYYTFHLLFIFSPSPPQKLTIKPWCPVKQTGFKKVVYVEERGPPPKKPKLCATPPPPQVAVAHLYYGYSRLWFAIFCCCTVIGI